jgi:hypothetical protein
MFRLDRGLLFCILSFICTVGCGARIEEMDELLPQERKFATVPLQVEFKGEVFLQDFKSDPVNLGLSMKEGASFVYQDIVLTNADEEPQVLEYRFEELPVLKANTQLSWGVYRSFDRVVQHHHQKLFFVRHDFTSPEPRIRIENQRGEMRFEPLNLSIDDQTIVIPGKSVVTVEVVYKNPKTLGNQAMGSPCYDTQQAWYSMIGWKTEIQYSRDLCLIEKSRRCLSQQNWISLPRSSQGKGQQRRPDIDPDAAKSFDEGGGGAAFPLFQNALIDYANVPQRNESEMFCTRWIR